MVVQNIKRRYMLRAMAVKIEFSDNLGGGGRRALERFRLRDVRKTPWGIS